MKIVLDTNVIVSAVLSPHGPPAQVLGLALDGLITLCVDGRIEAEYREVLNRPKLGLAAGDVETLREAGRAFGFDTQVVPPVRVDLGGHPDTVISSSLVRHLISSGTVDRAAKFPEQLACKGSAP